MTVIKIIRISLAMCPQTKNESATETKSHRRTRYDKGENDEQIKLKLCALGFLQFRKALFVLLIYHTSMTMSTVFIHIFKKFFKNFFSGRKMLLRQVPRRSRRKRAAQEFFAKTARRAKKCHPGAAVTCPTCAGARARICSYAQAARDWTEPARGAREKPNSATATTAVFRTPPPALRARRNNPSRGVWV